MYASKVRTCGLGAVVAVLLGGGIGVGWHYFADTAGGRAVAAAATPLAKQDAPNPPPSNPPSRPAEGPSFRGSPVSSPIHAAISRPERNFRPSSTAATIAALAPGPSLVPALSGDSIFFLPDACVARSKHNNFS